MEPEPPIRKRPDDSWSSWKHGLPAQEARQQSGSGYVETPGAHGSGPRRKKTGCKKSPDDGGHEYEPQVLWVRETSEVMEDKCIYCGKIGRTFTVRTKPIEYAPEGSIDRMFWRLGD